MDDLQNFKEYALYPSLYNSIDLAFPEMEFKRKGNRWESNHHLDGSRNGGGKVCTYIYENSKFCVVEHGADSTPNLINFYMSLHSCDFREALKALSDICHLTPPQQDSEEWKRYTKQQERRATALRTFTSALWGETPEAVKVREYLYSRKWTEEEIRKAELGLITSDLIASLPDGGAEFKVYAQRDGQRVGGAGTTHLLAIPYRNGSRLFGFKLREVGVETGTKYLNTYGLQKSKGLFGIGVGVKDVTIVEGELDALHAKVKGAENVVATTGGAATTDQIIDAFKRGVRRFTLLFDNDERGRGFILPTITAVENAGGEAYVAFLPEEVKDTDEYLASHSIEELKDICSFAIPSYFHRYTCVKAKYEKRQEEQGGDLSFKDRNDFLAEIDSLLLSMKPQDREIIYSELANLSKSLKVDMEGYREYLDRKHYQQLAKERRGKVTEASKAIAEALENGNTDEAIKLMRETAAEAGAQDRATEFAKVFAPLSTGDFDKYLSEIPEGIPTGFTFEQGHQKEPLTLNAGLTFICGYRGHGKTSFLNNIALNEAKRNVALGNGKKVLYFSYEVDKRRLIADLLNTYINDPELSRNPSSTIASYFKGKGAEYFSGSRITDPQDKSRDGLTHYENFTRQLLRFKKELIASGSLLIVEENYKVEQLLAAIEYYLSTNKVSIVCIDYAQLIYSEDFSRLRTEEIKKVVNDIKDFANKKGIPFVMAAQFNRNVNSPISVTTDNIGEGGDFERIADTCIGLFNLKELHPLPRMKDEDKEAKKLLSDMGVATYPQGESLKPIQGKLFVRLMKRRYGYYPLDIILDWEGKTKYIAPNDKKALSTDPKQGSIFPDFDGLDLNKEEVYPF